MTRLSKLKFSWRRGKQYTSPVTVGGGIIKVAITKIQSFNFKGQKNAIANTFKSQKLKSNDYIF